MKSLMLLIITSFIFSEEVFQFGENSPERRWEKIITSIEVFKGLESHVPNIKLGNMEIIYQDSKYIKHEDDRIYTYDRWYAITIMKIDDKYYKGEDNSIWEVMSLMTSEIRCLKQWEQENSISEKEVDEIINPNIFKRIINIFKLF